MGGEKMNSQWQIDLFDGLQKAIDIQDVLDVSLKTVQPLGFEFCTFKTKFALPLANRKTYVLGTNEDKVNQKNSSGGYDEAPVTTHCSKTNIPAIWTGKNEGAIFEKDPALVEEYFSWGHKGGWAQSVNEGGGQFSMFIVDSPEIMTQSYLENDVNFNLEWITIAVHSVINRIRNATPSKIQLSEREKEVLRWTGDGKTADEIGLILNLSHSTVNFHLRKAMFKLNAPNKTSAVVKAVYLNLLH